MLNAIIRYALNHRRIVLALTALIVVYGGIALKHLPIDVFPDLTKPTVTIMTESHGMAPEEVETQVTYPIESFLNGIPGVERVRSQSGVGLSVIYVEFNWDTDIYRNRQLVQEKLNLAKERLPMDISPVIGPIGSLMGQIQQIAVSTASDKIDPMELRNIAEWTLRPRLMMIPGIAQVVSIGGGLKQYQILVSAEKLNRYQLSLAAVDDELAQIGQNTTGGFLEKDGQELLIRNIGAIENLEDIRRTLVGLHFGKPVLIRDIAQVKEAPKLKRGDGSFNGKPAVIMTIQKQPGADTVKISADISRTISEMKQTLPPGITVNPDVFKQANFIEAAVDGIIGKLKLGTVLVFVILFIFFANMRMSIVTLTAIPVAFMATAIVFRMFGLSVNTMTLGGLAIAIGELVDDSIVDVENVFRRLRENSMSPNPVNKLNVIFSASSEVRNSIVLATVVIALVFIPLFNLDGLEGRLFTPLAVAYLAALAASLLVSLTLTPVLCSYFLRGGAHLHSDTKFVVWLKAVDQRLLTWALPKSNLVLAAAAVLFFGATSLTGFMGRDFLPRFNEGTAMIALIAPPGISLTESSKIGLRAESIMLSKAEVKSVSRRTGRAELDEHAAGVHVSEIDIDFHQSGREREVVLNEIRTNLKSEFPDIGVNVGQPISHLMDHMISGVNAAIAIKIFGEDLSVLREKATELEALISDVDGLVDLRVEEQGLVPQLKIRVLRQQAAQFGISPGEITKLLEAAFNGEEVAKILEGNQTHNVFYQFDRDSRATIERMENTVLKVLPNGMRVTLSMVADLYETTGPNEVNRENGQRRIVVSANVSGRDLVGVVDAIKSRVTGGLELPSGYYVIYDGQFKSQQSASRKIILFSLLSLIGVIFVLMGHFHSKAITAQVMLTIPLAFVGGIILLFFIDRSITVASLVGFVTLCGVASRNAIMMISHYLRLLTDENETFSKEMIIRGSQERLVPVMMTALVASLALLPLVFARSEPGSEVLHPVAVVIVGGLISSTLLDIIVTPVLFYRFGARSVASYMRRIREQVII